MDRSCFPRLLVFVEIEHQVAREKDVQPMNAGYGKWIDVCIETKYRHHTWVRIRAHL